MKKAFFYLLISFILFSLYSEELIIFNPDFVRYEPETIMVGDNVLCRIRTIENVNIDDINTLEVGEGFLQHEVECLVNCNLTIQVFVNFHDFKIGIIFEIFFK